MWPFAPGALGHCASLQTGAVMQGDHAQGISQKGAPADVPPHIHQPHLPALPPADGAAGILERLGHDAHLLAELIDLRLRQAARPLRTCCASSGRALDMDCRTSLHQTASCSRAAPPAKAGGTSGCPATAGMHCMHLTQHPQNEGHCLTRLGSTIYIKRCT